METGVPIKFYSGTSGLVLPVPNKQCYPPEFQDRSRLEYYASLFNSIEVNSSFYKVPMAATVKNWADSVPNRFRFTYKLWRNITHNKGLAFDVVAIGHFMQVITNTGTKKGCLLIQFPPGLKVEAINKLEGLLSLVRQNDPEMQWHIAVEFRHKSWYQDKTYYLLDKYYIGLVIHDLPTSSTPIMETEADFIYLRFHGPNGGYSGSYPDEVLQEYTGFITDWLSENKTVYAYFNNTMGEAVKNLATLNRLVYQK